VENQELQIFEIIGKELDKSLKKISPNDIGQIVGRIADASIDIFASILANQIIEEKSKRKQKKKKIFGFNNP
jgi:hypothetical protein